MLNKESFLKASIYSKLYFEVISTLIVKILLLWELLNLKRAKANDYQQFKIQIQTILHPQSLAFKQDLSLCEKRTCIVRALVGWASHLPDHCLYWRNVSDLCLGCDLEPCDLTLSPQETEDQACWDASAVVKPRLQSRTHRELQFSGELCLYEGSRRLPSLDWAEHWGYRWDIASQLLELSWAVFSPFLCIIVPSCQPLHLT